MKIQIPESFLNEFISKNGGTVQGDERTSKLQTVVNFLTKDKKIVPTADKHVKQAGQTGDWYLRYSNYMVKEDTNLEEDVLTVQRNRDADVLKNTDNIKSIQEIQDIYGDKGVQPIIDTTNELGQMINNLYQNFEDKDNNEIRAAILGHFLDVVNFNILSSQQLKLLKNKLNG